MPPKCPAAQWSERNAQDGSWPMSSRCRRQMSCTPGWPSHQHSSTTSAKGGRWLSKSPRISGRSSSSIDRVPLSASYAYARLQTPAPPPSPPAPPHPSWGPGRRARPQRPRMRRPRRCGNRCHNSCPLPGPFSLRAHSCPRRPNTSCPCPETALARARPPQLTPEAGYPSPQPAPGPGEATRLRLRQRRAAAQTPCNPGNQIH
mmetsp:Transcript_16010/g.44675  ORF Transcript_16010/g.44675 Transcript_16010/m.44675 type:complete len:203 (+) Transcript_16010:652-1260(+)